MALYTVVFSGIASGTALKTIAQIATTATKRARVIEWSLSFNGTSATAVPVLVQLNRQTTVGSGGATVTAQPWDPADGVATTTAISGPTTEPTAGTVIYADTFTPVGLGPAWQYPSPREIVVPVSGRLAIVVTAAVSINCAGHILIEE